METVLRNINNVLVYIDDVLLHTATHEEHLKVLEKVFEQLHQNHLKVNLDKCVFGNREVSYLGFMLTPEGIKPGRNKLQAIRDAQPPTNIKLVRSFVGLCKYFCTHIKDFAIITSKILQSLRHHCSRSPERTSDTKMVPYLQMPFMLSKCSNNNSHLTLSWLFLAQIASMLSSQTQLQVQLIFLVVWEQF
jgi:hypothetical protein